jgi:hypothetical protein
MKKIVFMSLWLGAATLLLNGCSLMAEDKRKKDQMIKNTIECTYDGGVLLVRFERDEVVVHHPDLGRVYLYRAPSIRGILYTNGEYELFGKGTDITFGTAGDPIKLTCKQYDPDGRSTEQDAKDLKVM